MAEFKDYRNVKSFVSNRFIVSLDLETTGLSAQSEKIVEIGAIKYLDGEFVKKYSQLLNPQKLMDQKVINIHGITNEELIDKPIFSSIAKEFYEFLINSNPILVIQNARFDLSFLDAEFNSSGYPKLTNDYICTKNFSTYVLPDEKHNLGRLAEIFKIDNPNYHRAVNDAEVCLTVFSRLSDLM